MSRILVVEDSSTQAEQLRLVLKDEGYHVEVAVDGQQGLDRVLASDFDLVISDVLMPVLSGYDLCRRIKAHPDKGHVPVLLLTLLRDPLDILQGVECGADNYLTKPYHPEALLDRVRYIFDNQARRAAGGVTVGVEVSFLGRTFAVTSEKEQILDLLLATCVDVVRANRELNDSRAELLRLHEELDGRVKARTAELAESNAALRQEVEVRRRAEVALRDERDFNSALLDTEGAMVVVLDRDARVVRFNRACESLTGYSFAEVRGRDARELFLLPEEAEAVSAVFEGLRDGNYPGECENHWATRAGGRRLIAWSNTALSDERGAVKYVIGTGIDVTEKRGLEARYLQAQKMEAVGRLAAGVAHDFNNLLTIINGYSEVLLDRWRGDGAVVPMVEEILKAGERAAGLTRQLLAFSRQQVVAPRVLDLNAVVSGVEKMLVRVIGEDVTLTFTPNPALGHVKADPGQVEQVLLNLAVNARDAMPTGGRLTIATADVELNEGYARLHPEVRSGRYVLVAVTDTGCGMAEETQARIFEPFFTTKELGKGTGLGLATVYGIVQQAGGHVAVSSKPGHGSTFKVYLPRVEAALSAGAETGLPRRASGTETVLLVEDEDAVRTLARRVLEARGYAVLEARDGAEALRLSGANSGEIQLLLTDVVMPGMSGRELADRLTALRPRLKVLYLSGYADDAVVRHGVLEAEVEFVQKPFTVDGLAHKIREVLDREAGGGRGAAARAAVAGRDANAWNSSN